MKCLRGWHLAAGLLLFAAAHAAHAAPGPAAQAEISYLLSTVANSDCEFYRNGNWYNSKFAADHISSKYKYLLAGNLVQSTEDFIEKAATRSSMSGRDYAIRCGGGAAVPTAQWLLILLARYRESHTDALTQN
jgi:Family of unknown function (DUF5329)